jgi:hypothetical protein
MATNGNNMKIPCKELEHTHWFKKGVKYQLIAGNLYWQICSESNIINLPFFTTSKSKLEIKDWLKTNGYNQLLIVIE